MPKVKTKKAAVKRLKITGKGKILRAKSFGKHLKLAKSKKQIASFKKKLPASKYNAKKFRRLISGS